MAKMRMEYDEDFKEDEKLAKRAQREKEAKEKKDKELEERKKKREIRENENKEYERWLLGKNPKPTKEIQKTAEQKESLRRRKKLNEILGNLKRIDQDINPNHKKKENTNWNYNNDYHNEEEEDEVKKQSKNEHVGAWDRYSLHTVSKLNYPAVKDNCKPKLTQSFAKPQKYANYNLPIQMMKAKALKAAAN
ncbi:unnamed protein product [Blepharisma stoltei]|uniref:Coiled-coil domain-containing protein 124 n=1 Tax=Blepharisma stoltei TaxID=1481888 RepID=A0AAU9JNR1_9CILI|nr:unnamed protein product [Blepharisma stoltei]